MKRKLLITMMFGLFAAFFMMPMSAKAADVKLYLEAGEGHGNYLTEELVSDININSNFSDAKLDGTKISFLCSENIKVGEVRLWLGTLCSDEYDGAFHHTGGKDGIGLHPTTDYVDKNDFTQQANDTDSKTEEENQVFYIQWQKKIEAINIDASLICGEEFEKKAPVADVKCTSEHVKILTDENGPVNFLVNSMSYDISTENQYSGKISPDKDYFLYIVTSPDFGYYMDGLDMGGPSTKVYVNGEQTDVYQAVGSSMRFTGIIEAKYITHQEGSAKNEKIVKPTCTEEGSHEEATYCTGCGKELSRKTVTDKATGHDWGDWKVTKEATVQEEGVMTRVCKNDASHKETKAIPKLKEEQKKKTTKKKKPAQRKVSSELFFNEIKSVGSKKLKFTWTKLKNADGYDVYFCKCITNGKEFAPKKIKTIKGNSVFTYTKGGLKSHCSYRGYVRAYVIKGGKKKYVKTGLMVHAYTGKYMGNETNSKSVTLPKNSVVLKKGKTFRIKASVTPVIGSKKVMSTEHAPKLRYKSSAPSVASVNRSGKITAKKAGSCKVYAIAVSGAKKAITVKVK